MINFLKFVGCYLITLTMLIILATMCSSFSTMSIQNPFSDSTGWEVFRAFAFLISFPFACLIYDD